MAPQIGSSSPDVAEIEQQSGFHVDKMIGVGNFSFVYMGSNKETGEKVAIKVEAAKSAIPQLLYEAKVYKSLAKGSTSIVPKVHWCGAGERLNILVMDLLGPTLEDVFVNSGRTFSRQVVTMLGRSILSSVKFLHSKGFIHRHIKPHNLVFQNSLDKLQLIDFGFAKKFRDRTQAHIASSTNKPFLGDSVFASLRTHVGFQQSRRDDIESVAFVLFHLSLGSLPWDGLSVSEMREQKASCCAQDFGPTEIIRFLTYARSLSFEAAPDYGFLRSVLEPRKKRDASKVEPCARSMRRRFTYDFVSDWTFHLHN